MGLPVLPGNTLSKKRGTFGWVKGEYKKDNSKEYFSLKKISGGIPRKIGGGDFPDKEVPPHIGVRCKLCAHGGGEIKNLHFFWPRV